jgi:hypothetical protein
MNHFDVDKKKKNKQTIRFNLANVFVVLTITLANVI